MNPLKPYKEHIVGELAEIARWTVLNVQTGISWPYEVQKVRWKDRDLFILPASEDAGAGIGVKLEKHETYDDVQKLLLTFLSALCWVERGGAEVLGFGGGSRHPVPWDRQRRYGSIIKQLDLTYLPEPTTEKARLALALFREGSSLNHPAFAFLSFFRVLEVKHAHGNAAKMIRWINHHTQFLVDHEANEIIGRLKTKHADLGAYLYESGRCAIAHANDGVIVDPDDYADARRLHSELPLMRALAIRLIELTLGVKTSHTIWKEHLYELEGYRKIVGEDFVPRIHDAKDKMEGTTFQIPTITVGLIGKEPYPALANLIPYGIQRTPQGLQISYASDNDLIFFRVLCDFQNERLEFDYQRDLGIGDDGSVRAAEDFADISKFVWDYCMNGKLVITQADTGERLSRKDAYLPVNMMFRGGENEERKNALLEAEKRKADIERLIAIVRNDLDLMIVLTTVRGLGLNDWLVFSGAVYQAAWNDVTGRAPGYGVKDFDVGYFDEDVSWDAEDAVIKRVAEAFEEPLRSRVEVRNQRRVSEWFEAKFGEPYPPIEDTAEALTRFVAPAFAVGVRLEEDDQITVIAPFTLSDVFAMVIRPNPHRPLAKDWDRVTARALERWPELTIVAPK